MTSAPRWNHNIHYHSVVMDAVPRGARRALDIGCGEGTLCRQLRERVPHVVGIDADAECVRRARDAGGDIEYRLGRFEDADFEPHSFDLVTAVASLHHGDERAAFRRMKDLLAPGGVLVVIGLGRRSRADLAHDAAGFIAHRVLARRHGVWNHDAPIAEPTRTFPELRRIAAAELPGARFRHRVLFRYSLVWRRPGRNCGQGGS